jgi:hypothetical protein
MAQFTQIFIYLLIMQMFYSFCVTMFVPLIPAAQAQQVVMYTDSQGVLNFTTLSSTVQGAVNNQSTIPFLDLGALIFYSTSILLNLVLNFVTAVPQMVLWLLVTLFYFLPFPNAIQASVKMIFIIMLTVLYYLLLIFYITGQRTQSGMGV